MRFKVFLSIVIAGSHSVIGFFVGYNLGVLPGFLYGVFASVFYASIIMKLWNDGVD